MEVRRSFAGASGNCTYRFVFRLIKRHRPWRIAMRRKRTPTHTATADTQRRIVMRADAPTDHSSVNYQLSDLPPPEWPIDVVRAEIKTS
jgi:hypothetical protein